MASKATRPARDQVSPEIDWAGIRTDQVDYASGSVIFAQGDPAATIMCVETGTVRLSVVSHSGKEAVVAVLRGGHFFGEGCLAGQSQRIATATAMETLSGAEHRSR